jgi:ribonuclease-3
MNSRASAKIAQAEVMIGYTFKDPDILWEALQAPGSGVLRSGIRRIPNGNKRLAIVGDAALKLVINSQNYSQGLTRGDNIAYVRISLLNLRLIFTGAGNARLQLVEGNTNLVRVANANRFPDFINSNPAHVGDLGARTLADTVEAVIGAVYLDGGLGAVPAVLVTLGLV